VSYLIVITALFVMISGTFLYALIRSRLSLKKFFVLLSLRLFFAGILIWLMTDPMITFLTTHTKPQKIYLLIDQSQSMTIRDTENSNLSRLEQIGEILFGSSLKALRSSENVLFEIVGIGDTLRRSIQPPLEPIAYQSNIIENVSQFMESIQGDKSALVYVVSDGCSTDKDFGLSEIPSEIPVNTISVGNPDDQVDCMIHSVRAPSEVDIEEPIDFYIRIGEQKMPPETKLLVSVLDEENKVIAQTEVVSPVKDEILLSYQPNVPGLHQYSITVEARDIIEPYKENNIYKTAVLVEKKDVRVMVIGKPAWDMAFLLRALRDIRNVRLSVYNVEGDTSGNIFSLQAASEQAVSEVLDQLSDQDVLILCNAPAGIFSFPDIQRIERFVEIKGGGLWFIGGESSLGSGRFIGSQLTKLLPVFLIDNDYIYQPYRVVPAQTSRSHPVCSGFTDNLDSNQIPPLTGINLVEKAKPVAETFLKAQLSSGGQQFPLFSVMNYGKGKTAVFAGKGFYRWYMEGGLRPGSRDILTTFVLNVISWIVSPTDRSLMHVRFPSVKYILGEKVHTEAVVLDTTYSPASSSWVRGNLVGPGGFERPIDFVPIPGEQSGFSATFLPPQPGKYYLTITGVRSDGNETTVETGFYVIPSSEEFGRLAANIDLLKDIADATGGTYYDLEKFDAFLKSYKPQAVKEKVKVTRMAVDYPFILMALLGMIIAEWVIRIREGLN
jgi:uncharacterized membrane protein